MFGGSEFSGEAIAACAIAEGKSAVFADVQGAFGSIRFRGAGVGAAFAYGSGSAQLRFDGDARGAALVYGTGSAQLRFDGDARGAALVCGTGSAQLRFAGLAEGQKYFKSLKYGRQRWRVAQRPEFRVAARPDFRVARQ